LQSRQLPPTPFAIAFERPSGEFYTVCLDSTRG